MYACRLASSYVYHFQAPNLIIKALYTKGLPFGTTASSRSARRKSLHACSPTRYYFMLPRKKSKPNPKAETEADTEESPALKSQGQGPGKQELPQSSPEQALPHKDPQSPKPIKGGHDVANTVGPWGDEERRHELTSTSLNPLKRGTVAPGLVETKPIL